MKITILSGSVRDGRNTHQVAVALTEKLNQRFGVEAMLIDLKEMELPPLTSLYSETSPANVKYVYNALNEADVLIFASPEYNGSYSSALKNAIDFYPKSTYKKKPIGVVSVSAGALGGIRAAQHLQLQILGLMAFPLYRMLTVPNVEDKFNNGKLTDEKFAETMESYIDELIWLSDAIVMKKKNS